MSQIKDSKPRRKQISGFGYVHARYLADVLCDPSQPKDLRRAANLGFAELCILTGIAEPKAEPTPRAWEKIRKAYIEAQRAVEEIDEIKEAWCEDHLAALEAKGVPLSAEIQAKRRDHNDARTAWFYSLPGLTKLVAEHLSGLLHHLWCRDNLKPAYSPTSWIDLERKHAPASSIQRLKQLQNIRLYIEEYGQSAVLKAIHDRDDLYFQAIREAMSQIKERDLKDFITGAQFRVTLTPDFKGA